LEPLQIEQRTCATIEDIIMNHGMSKSILISSLLALGIAVSLPVSSQTSGAGQGSAAGDAASAGGQGSNASAQSGAAASAVPTPGSGQMSSGTSSPSAMAGGASGATTTDKLDTSDEKFVTSAFQGNLAEIKLGQLAVAKAQTPEVKQFGQRIIDDHAAANTKLMKLAGQKGLQPKRELEQSVQHEYNKLDKLSGTQFDREFMNYMVSDHQKDIKEFEKVAKSAKDPDVKEFAESTLPTLQDHLTNAKSAQTAAKSAKKTASSS